MTPEGTADPVSCCWGAPGASHTHPQRTVPLVPLIVSVPPSALGGVDTDDYVTGGVGL